MPVAESSIVITNKVGLHARPARSLVQTAAQFHSEIRVLCGEKAANAKSIVGILKLGASQGDTLHLRADGDDAEGAIRALIDLIERKFDEEE